jgi:hypothetical protein
LQQELYRQLKGFSSPLQWGPTDLLIPYLQVIRDVEMLIAFVKTIPKFTLTDLLTLLIDKGITVNPYAEGAESVRRLNNTEDSLVIGMETLNRVLMRMGGMPEQMRFYMSADKLLEIFACTEPANGKEFVKIIEEGTKQTSKDYTLAEQLEEALHKRAQKMSQNTTSYFETKHSLIRRRWLVMEDFILEQAQAQCHPIPEPDVLLPQFTKLIRNVIKHYEEDEGEQFALTSRSEVFNDMYLHCQDDNIVLSDFAWEALKNEKDIELLNLIRCLIGIHRRELFFCRYRCFVCETPELWHELKALYLKGAV